MQYATQVSVGLESLRRIPILVALSVRKWLLTKRYHLQSCSMQCELALGNNCYSRTQVPCYETLQLSSYGSYDPIKS